MCGYLFSGFYTSGDGAHRGEDGYIRITGRMDDVINVSGHRLGTAEIEDAMVSCISTGEKSGINCDLPLSLVSTKHTLSCVRARPVCSEH